jgi:hypothetical protein
VQRLDAGILTKGLPNVWKFSATQSLHPAASRGSVTVSKSNPDDSSVAQWVQWMAKADCFSVGVMLLTLVSGAEGVGALVNHWQTQTNSSKTHVQLGAQPSPGEVPGDPHHELWFLSRLRMITDQAKKLSDVDKKVQVNALLKNMDEFVPARSGGVFAADSQCTEVRAMLLSVALDLLRSNPMERSPCESAAERVKLWWEGPGQTGHGFSAESLGLHCEARKPGV